MEKYVLSIMVDNRANVLARIAALFARRRFNIDTITASETSNPAITRITIVTRGDEDILKQIIGQTEKLQEVREVFVLEPVNSVMRELLMIKVAADVKNRSELRDIAEIYKAKVIDLSVDSMIMELTGKTEKIDGFLKVMAPYEILEMCRTGITGMERVAGKKRG
ncbi:MAG: acetolactate synthase small subunit [Lachnospiraceae bacterium]|nr:acetolactate synthase small subunit [Lachnospiraceae bacterium]